MVEDEFVSRELHNGVRLDRDCGPVSVDFRTIALLGLYQVMQKNRGGIGRGIPIQQDPPSLWSIARAESWAISKVGRMTTISQQASLRN